jgi:putative aldouronate transport system substrate-binding protein
MDAAILSGDSGAVVGPGGGAFGPWLLAAWENEPGTSYDLTATRFPTINRNELVRHGGTSPDLGTGSQGHAAISSSATEIEAITRLLDFGYSEEGHMLYNFGVYGVSWEWVNGEPTLTDMVTSNPEGRTFAQALSYFARAAINGPFDQDPRYLLQFYALDQQKAALDFWTMQNNSDQTILPPITLTQAEAQTVSARMADIDTYRREWIARFITGADPITDDTWGNFVDTLYGMGLEEVTAIHQAALDRYNSR